MRSVFFNREQRLRNGWWALIYLAFLGLGLTGFRALIPLFKRLGIASGTWVIGVAFLLSLGATWACTHLRKEPLSSAGWRLNARWGGAFLAGTLLGIGTLLLAAVMLWAFGGVTWEVDPARSAKALALGFGSFTLVALWEENLFRGFVFQRLLEGLGVWPTQLLLALLFGLAHWSNPGMQGSTKAWATLNIALAAVLLGLAYLRTRNLALPIGIHLGWNWAQGNLMGLGVSGTRELPGWFRPAFHGKPDWLSGGSFGAEASLFGVLALLVAIALLGRWRPKES